MTKLQKTCINWMTKNYGGKWLYAPHYEKMLRQWHVCTVYFESYVKVDIAFTAKGPFVKLVNVMLSVTSEKRRKPFLFSKWLVIPNFFTGAEISCN